jgi:hypothetical protein
VEVTNEQSTSCCREPEPGPDPTIQIGLRSRRIPVTERERDAPLRLDTVSKQVANQPGAVRSERGRPVTRSDDQTHAPINLRILA